MQKRFHASRKARLKRVQRQVSPKFRDFGRRSGAGAHRSFPLLVGVLEVDELESGAFEPHPGLAHGARDRGVHPFKGAAWGGGENTGVREPRVFDLFC